MKLSIIILFCDKDYKYLKNIISQIKEKANVDYEILLLDNRINNKKESLGLDNSDKIRIFDFNENTLNWGRLRLVNKATGDYIWFVDADDEILKFPDNCEYTKDVYVYNYFNEELDRVVEIKEGYHWDALWNKIIKTDLMKKIVEILNPKALISIFDDNIIYFTIERIAKDIEYTGDTVYKYKTSRAQIYNKNEKVYDKNKCKIMLSGVDTGDYKAELEKVKYFKDYDYIKKYMFFNIIDFCIRFTPKDVGIVYIKKMLKDFPEYKIDLFNLLSNCYYSINELTNIFTE